MMNFVIEANIGAGKSTLVHNIATYLTNICNISVQKFTEPTDLWEKTPEGNLLAMYGADPKTYAFPLQSLIMATMSKQRQNLSSADVRLFERSLDSARFIFQQLLEKDGLITSLESYILNNIYDAIKVSKPRVDGVIYLKVNLN